MKLNFSGIWIVAIMFYGLALYTFIAKKPMNFWAGHKISSKKIKNIKAYNICLAIMWLFLGIYFSIGTYFLHSNNINMVYTIYHIFIRYILLIMIIYYSIIWYYFKVK